MTGIARVINILRKVLIISTKATRHIGNYLETNPIGLVVATPGVIFDRYNGVIPDVVYLSNEKCETMIYGGRFTVRLI